MKTTRLTNLAALTAVLILTACSSAVPLKTPAPIENRSASIVNDGSNSADPRGVARVESNTTDSLNDLKGILAKRSVYFDYDSYDVKPEFRPLVEAHARYLLSNKNRRLLIQGNTDERGGSEYNLALGQRRADSVRKLMSSMGVPESSIESVSLGKEKPKATGSSEEAWAENRRADLVYQ